MFTTSAIATKQWEVAQLVYEFFIGCDDTEWHQLPSSLRDNSIFSDNELAQFVGCSKQTARLGKVLALKYADEFKRIFSFVLHTSCTFEEAWEYFKDEADSYWYNVRSYMLGVVTSASKTMGGISLFRKEFAEEGMSVSYMTINGLTRRNIYRLWDRDRLAAARLRKKRRKFVG